MQRSRPLLGTFVAITAYGEDRARVQRAVSEAFAEVERVDALLSIHRPESELARLNAEAGQGPLEVSGELFEALALARQISERTAGAFDVTVGPLTRLWGFIWKEHRLPQPDELARVRPLIGSSQVTLQTNGPTGSNGSNGSNRSISLSQPGMLLDFGGIGKGIAVDRALAALQRGGVHHALVRAGGDLRVIGAPPGQTAWEIQLEDPDKKGRRFQLRLKDAALSTSGNYENFFEIGGQRYSHIIDPRTGMPVKGIASCTVIAPTCAESDALATGFFVMGVEASLAQFGGEFGIRFIRTDGTVAESAAFAPHAPRGSQTAK